MPLTATVLYGTANLNRETNMSTENENVVQLDARPRVGTEVCEAEFQKFVEAMDLDVDPKGMDEEDKESFVSCKRIMMRAMEDGSLVVNENGECVYTPKKGKTDPITFYEPTGASYMAMDSKKKGHDVSKTYATMADITHQDIIRFSKMANRDIKVCSAIVQLFLA